MSWQCTRHLRCLRIHALLPTTQNILLPRHMHWAVAQPHSNIDSATLLHRPIPFPILTHNASPCHLLIAEACTRMRTVDISRWVPAMRAIKGPQDYLGCKGS